MTMALRFGIAALALLAAGCDKKDAAQAPAGGSAPAPVAAPSGTSWTDQVVKTPQGGFLMGNPDAKVKLVEYASLTCPHCADFAVHAIDQLKAKYIATGQVSWEFRNFLLNPIDAAASLLARCQGPGPVFKLTEQLYAEQPQWTAKFQAVSQADAQRIQSLPENQQFVALAKAGSLDTFFKARGLPAAKIDQCLSDKAGIAELVAIRQLGSETDKITGTPSFLINGKLQDNVYNWETLEPQLRAAIG